MKIIISLILSCLAFIASAEEIKYRVATTDYGETIVFSNRTCPINENMGTASITEKGGGNTVVGCYFIELEYVLIVFVDGSAVRIEKSSVHLQPTKDI